MLAPVHSARRRQIVARADYSGTTEIFTTALSAFSDDWRDTMGVFADGLNDDEKPIRWNDSVVTLWGRTNRGVSGIVLSYRCLQLKKVLIAKRTGTGKIRLK